MPQIALTGGTIAERGPRRAGRGRPRRRRRLVAASSSGGATSGSSTADSDDRNARDARRSFLDPVGVPDHHVHEAPATDTAGSAAEAAAAYAQTLREHGAGAFEVLMLGIGPDGHCASLFPGHPALDVDDQVAVAVTDSPKPPPERISLTFAALNRSRAIWFVASGEEKADAVARALADEGDLHDTPARGVTGLPDATAPPQRSSGSSTAPPPPTSDDRATR